MTEFETLRLLPCFAIRAPVAEVHLKITTLKRKNRKDVFDGRGKAERPPSTRVPEGTAITWDFLASTLETASLDSARFMLTIDSPPRSSGGDAKLWLHLGRKA
jgi:hypothetical protein